MSTQYNAYIRQHVCSRYAQKRLSVLLCTLLSVALQMYAPHEALKYNLLMAVISHNAQSIAQNTSSMKLMLVVDQIVAAHTETIQSQSQS
jgi:hypothetical protein